MSGIPRVPDAHTGPDIDGIDVSDTPALRTCVMSVIFYLGMPCVLVFPSSEGRVWLACLSFLGVAFFRVMPVALQIDKLSELANCSIIFCCLLCSLRSNDRV